MKKVLSVWKTVILVISALIGVAGVTVLSLYLMGQLDEEKVEPQDIVFENVLAEGDGFYNENLSQFEVASDFKLTISTTTENVTERNITLSLVGGTTEADEDGYISDGVIKVKKYVELNSEIEILLESTFNAALDQEWIMGGESLLTATSSNVLIDPQSVKIAVDCLVEDIDLSVSGRDSSTETQSVVVGETFSIDTTFSPQAGGYLYSDSTRSKEIFYDMSKLYISYDWQTNKFTANTRSGNDFDTIRVYTFANSYYQQQILEMYSSITDREDLTSAVLRYFGEHPETCKSKSINIKVADVDVNSVSMDANGKTFDISFDKYYTITAKSAAANNTLGLSIKDSKSNSLNNLFANVGIKLPVESADFAKLSFVGGKIAKVSKYTDGRIAIEEVEHVDGMEFPVEDAASEIEKITYYLLPNTAPKYASDYYWKFWVSSNTNADVSFDLKVNFFYENEDNEIVSFFDTQNGGTNTELGFTLSLSAQNQGIEEKVGWTNQAGIPMVINFEEDGTPISANYDLSKEITAIPSTNLYQTVRYFVLLPNDSAITAGQIENYFSCSAGKLYTKDYQGTKDLTITNVEMPADGYELFELDGSVLTAKKSLQGKVYVVAATIKTYADGTPYIDTNSTETTADDKYMIVKISNAREVYVSSSLSIANMNPTFEFEDENDRIYQDDASGEYFVPSVVKNNSNEEMDLIKFKLTLNNCENFDTEDASSEIAKVLRAFNTPSEDLKLYIECDETTKQYVSLKNVTFAEDLSDKARKIAVFEGVLQINKDELETSTSKDLFGTLVKLNLIFEDGANTFKKAIVKEDDASESFRIYNQQVCAITGSYDDGLENETVIVDVKSTGVTISWGTNRWQDDNSGTAISKLGEKLIFEMIDQFGQPIYSEDGIYKVKFEETSGSINKVLSFGAELDKIQNFNATNGATVETQLTVYVVEKSASGQETKVGKFAADGTLERDDQGNIIPLSSPDIAFSVKSEGVAEVWYNSYDGSSVTTGDEKIVWTKSSSTSAIKISRYVTTGDVFDLENSAVKIFTSKIDEGNTMTDEEETQKVSNTTGVTTEFYFDPTFLSGLEDKGAGLRKMFSEIKLATGEVEPTDNTTLEAYRGKKIASVTFAYPFVDDGIEIAFKATGINGSLFDITITLECVADLSISTSKFDAYEETYKDYLIKDGNKISIFADQEFNLDEYAKLSSATGKMGSDASYSWKKIGDDYYEMSSTEIASIKDGILTINSIYDYTTLTLTLYYGPKTNYACSITLQFYINPNILVKQVKTSEVELDKIASTDGVSIADHYKFYKAVGEKAYLNSDGTINTETGDKAPAEISVISNYLTYDNESAIKYIQIANGKINFANGQNAIDFKLGQSYNQSFTLKYENGSITTPQLKAVKITKDGTVELNDKGVRLTFDLVYAENGNVFVNSNTDDTEFNVEKVVYNGTEYLLFLADNNYYINKAYTVVNYSGLIRKSGDHGLITDPISQGYLSVDGNMFELSQTFKNADGSGSLAATILFRAIVSGFGDKFVYYNNAEFDASSLSYNYYKYEDGTQADLKDVLELLNTNVYQVLDAGEYTVVHNTSSSLKREFIKQGATYYLSKEDAANKENSQTALENIYFGEYKEEADTCVTGEIIEIKMDDGTTYYIESADALGFGEEPKTLADTVGFYFNGQAAGAYTGANNSSVKVSIVETAEGYVENLATLSKVKDTDDYETILTINNISKEYIEKYGDVFVTLKFEIYKTAYSSQKFEMYYRIKVNPSYTLGGVTYPYSDDEEYLSETHASFDGEQYVINLEEKFDETNSDSKNIDKKRFADATTLEAGEIENISASYKISSVKLGDNEISAATYFETLELSADGILTAKLNAVAAGAEIVVVVTKTLSLDDQEMIGSSRDYTFKFNQGSVYEHSLSATIGTEEKPLETTSDNIYTQSITAGCGEITYAADIKIQGSNNSYTNVTDYKAYVKMLTEGCILEDALQAYADKENAPYYYMDENNILHINPDATIAKDMQLEIGYYTSERVVFKVIVDLKSYFAHELNNATTTQDFELVGGKTYSIYKTETKDETTKATADSLFANLSSTAGTTITNFKLELLNGTVEYSDGVVLSDLVTSTAFSENGVNINDTTTLETIKITFAHLPKDATFKFRATLTDEKGTYSFEFELFVKASVDTSATRSFNAMGGIERYTNETFTVEIDDTFVNEAIKFADKSSFTFVTTSNTTIEITYAFYTDTTIYPREQLEVAYNFNEKTIFTFYVEYRYKVAPSVAVEAYHPAPDGKTEIAAEYISTNVPTGGEIAYKSEDIKNFFNTAAQHAMTQQITKADGSTEERTPNRIDIVTKTTYTDMNSSTPEVTDYWANIGENWTILVSEISNVKLHVIATDVNKIITAAGADRTILQDYLVGTMEDANDSNRPDIMLTFEIENAQSEGSVSFLVTINGVTTEYNVIVCLGSAYSVSHASPNYANNQEIIYAEDLTKQELNIFAEDRIASFITKDGSAVGTYYLRFVNKTNADEVITPDITISQYTSSITNIDLGKSFKAYNYEGTFATEKEAKAGLAENNLDEILYANGMNITNRFVVSYGGTELKLDNEEGEGKYTLQLLRREDGATLTLATDFNVSESDYAKQVTVEAHLLLGDYAINLNSRYSYYLDVELEVDGAANDISGYETHILQANGGLSGGDQTPYQLMNVVDIYNKRTKAAYGTNGLANSAGTIDLQIYGYENLPVATSYKEGNGKHYLTALDAASVKAYLADVKNSEENKLSAIAGYIHNSLISTDVEISERDSIRYYTGLLPTYKLMNDNGTLNINTSASDFTSYDNYISIAGAETGKTTDYKLFANAANNDGNHVMMRLAYIVDINGSTAGGEITKYFNLLFKVEANSNVLFATGLNSSNYLPGAEETDNQQTIISNYQQVYQIEQESLSGGESTLRFVGDTDQNQVWQALMYGNQSKDSANDFKYTITIDKAIGSVTYNDLKDFQDWLDKDNGTRWTKSGNTYTSNNDKTTGKINDLQVQIPSINLGTRYYMVEIENKFGYRARFYCRYVSTINPQILSMTSYTLTENTNLAFLANYNEATGSYYGSTSEHEHSEFTYTRTQGADADLGNNLDNNIYYNNTIKVENKTGNKLTVKAYVKNWKELPDGYADISRTLEPVNAGSTGYLNLWDATKEYGGWSDDIAGDGGPLNGNSFNSPDEVLVGRQIIITVSIDGTEKDGYYTISNPGYLSRWVEDKEKFVTGTEGNYTEQEGVKVETKTTTKDEDGQDTTTTKTTYAAQILDPVNLTQTYTVSQEGTKPTVNAGDDQDTTSVHLSGLTAIGFGEDEAKAIDANAIKAENSGLESNVTNIKVQSVDFYYDGEWLGGSWASNAYSKYATVNQDTNKGSEDEGVPKDEKNNPITAPIITSSDMYFAYKEDGNIKVEKGKGGNLNEDSPYIFKVPYINGILYGTGSSLSNVTMNVTLVDNQGNSTVISTVVTINRKATTSGSFVNNNIQDGNSPDVKASLRDSGATVLNDTLEVTMAANSSVTFMVHNNEVSEISDDWSTATVGTTTFAPKLITLTNANNYQVTKYVGISASIVGLEDNLKADSGFYVYVLENSEETPATFDYNGKVLTDNGVADFEKTDNNGTPDDTNDDTTYTIKGYSGTIGKYESDSNALKLRFSSVEEVQMSNTKTEKLFFLYSAYSQTYQFIDNFNVYPLYTSAATADGTNKITVDDYMIATNDGGTTDDTTYYMVSLDSWAQNIYLYNTSVGIDEEGEVGRFVSSGTKVPAYKFYFKINEDKGGSAFVDENGLITTNTTYNINEHQMAVDIYMKVSGPEGDFEDINQRLLIGTFIINLNPAKATSNNYSIKFDENNNVRYGTYNNNNLISLAANTTLTGSSTGTIGAISDYSDSETYTFSVAQDASLNLKEALDAETHGASEWTNKNYHIVKDGDTYIHYNNLNAWTFTEIGVHEIVVVVSGRDEDKETIQYKALTNIQVVVYDNAINEEKTFEAEVGATTNEDGTTTYGAYIHKLDTGFAWYLRNEDGSVRSLTNGEVVINEIKDSKGKVTNSTGIFQKQFIAVKGSEVKNCVYTYYVYTKEEDKSVALTNTETLKLEDLIETKEEGAVYTFYDTTFKPVEKNQKSYNGYGQNSTLTNDFYLHTENADGSQSLQKFVVNVKIISSDVTQRIVEFGPSGLTKEIIEDELKNALSKLDGIASVSSSEFLGKTYNQESKTDEYTIKTNVWTYEILDGKVLRDKDTNVGKEGKTYYFSYLDENENPQYYTTFLVSYRAAGAQKNEYYRFVFTYYEYQGEYHLTKVLEKANNNYPLTNLNDEVRGKITDDTTLSEDLRNAITNSSSVRYFTIEGEKFVEQTFVDVENSHYGEYFVLINGDYYKFTIALFGRTYEATADTFSNSDVVTAVKKSLGIDTAETSVELYMESNGKLVEAASISSGTTIYAKVDGTYYAFNITTKSTEAE